MRIGIFGGSFDPIHGGHLILAEQCRDQAKLDRVLFVPCAQQPLKALPTVATDRQRVEMIELAIAGHDAFFLSKLELERGGSSYTVETLEQLATEHPDDDLFLLIGDDSLESFANWRSPQRICELATPLVVNRPGSGAVDLSALKPFVSTERFAEIQQLTIVSPAIEISSTDLKKRIASQSSIRYLVPRAVEKYIEVQKIYG